MELLRLGLAGLTAAEKGLVATLFRLHGVDRSFIWTLAVEPPFDALLVDVQCPDVDFKHLSGKHTHLMRLDPHGVQSDGAMPRPIRSDLLLNWLNSIEISLLHSTGDAFATTAHPSHHEHTSNLPQVKTPAAPLTTSRHPAANPSETQLPPEWALRSDSTEYKLKRWPTQSLLNKDVSRVRVATMISRRAMSLQEAASLARIPTQRCEDYLLEWVGHGLVTMSNRPAMPSHSDMQATPHATPHAATPVPRHGFGASLIHSIRKRFGIL